MIFVDTSGWFCALVPNDPLHIQARSWLDRNDQPLVTTDYVIDELLTLLRVRGEMQHALMIGAALLDGDLAQVEWVTQRDILDAWRTFQFYRDKEWSFTDCVSRAVMQRLQIKTAFATDHHFRQFGTVDVVP